MRDRTPGGSRGWGCWCPVCGHEGPHPGVERGVGLLVVGARGPVPVVVTAVEVRSCPFSDPARSVLALQLVEHAWHTVEHRGGGQQLLLAELLERRSPPSLVARPMSVDQVLSAVGQRG